MSSPHITPRGSLSDEVAEPWYPGCRNVPVNVNPIMTQVIRPHKRPDPYAHFACVGRYLLSLQERDTQVGYATDIELILGEESSTVHSSVVGAHSAYMMNKISEEHLPLSVNLDEKGITSAGLRRVINYCYSGTVWVSAESVKETLHAAAVLEVAALNVLLESYLIQISASPTYSFFCLKLAFEIGVKEETRECLIESAAKNFLLALTWPCAPLYFRDLNFEAAISLLQHPDVQKGSQLIPFHAAIEWIKMNESNHPEQKQEDCMDMVGVFNCIQFVFMKHKHLEYCVKTMQKDKRLKDYIITMSVILKQKLDTENEQLGDKEKQEIQADERSFKEDLGK